MNSKTELNRIYHPWNLWEDYENNFYDNCSGVEKEEKAKKVIEMFNSESLTRECMFYVVDNWRYSMEHNLTNNSMNKIAYIGQCACCYFGNIPNTITMECWSKLTNDVKERSNRIAKEAIDRWSENNKTIQLCLNLD